MEFAASGTAHVPARGPQSVACARRAFRVARKTSGRRTSGRAGRSIAAVFGVGGGLDAKRVARSDICGGEGRRCI